MSTYPPRLEARVSAQERMQTILHARIEELAQDMTESFKQQANYQVHFEQKVDAHFEKVDAQFNEVEARFNAVDKRFDQVEARIATIEEKMATKDDLVAIREDLAALENRILAAFQQLIAVVSKQPSDQTDK